VIAELGHLFLILALLLAIVQCLLPLIGAARHRDSWVAVAIPASRGQSLFLLLAILSLGRSFVDNDFTVRYVAEHSNSALPLVYRIAAVWGGHEGSLLLWALLLSGWGVAVGWRAKGLPPAFIARVLSVLGALGAGFISFMLFTSNPFDRLFPAPADGIDLNPLLQDPALAVHPPMLYMGYVGFSVVYGFAMAALIDGRFDAAWARWARPWTLAAWIFLTLGIGLGSFWAYYELGWGGWWFWDPVENASFMPWLVGTALVHSLIVTEKRGSFRNWTVLLSITAFGLSLLGTFLVRSGVLTSVHAFATDPARGIFILGFLTVAIGISFTLYALRASRMGFGERFGLVSRETLLLINNVLLSVVMATVLLGTLYPLLLDALGLGKISVGPPYFNAVFVLLMAPAIFLMGVGPLARWRNMEMPMLVHRLRWAAFAGGLALSVPLIGGGASLRVCIGAVLSAWLLACVLIDLIDRIRLARGAQGGVLLPSLPRAYLGMCTAHLGVALFILGVTVSGGYSVETERVVAQGESVEIAGYEFRFDGVREQQGPNYAGMQGTIVVSRQGDAVATLHPEKRVYRAGGRPMTEAAIDPGFTRHLYAALGEQVPSGAWTVRLYVKPFVQWIWTGVLCMALGGVLSMSDSRYRLRESAVRTSRPALRPITTGVPVPEVT
jgi:cytochrome c-type biogenesis protein CcmF